jgi:para-nitrobenzyl esterase
VAEGCLRVLGIAPADAARALRELPAGRYIDAQVKVQLELATSLGLLPFQPVADGDSLPSSALQPVRAGACAGVELMTGTTRDEWKLFTVMDPSLNTLDEPKLLERVGRDVPEVDADALYAVYRDARRERGQSTAPLEVFAAIQTDRTFRIPAVRLAEAQARHQPHTYMYRVDWESPMLGGVLGACHAVELPFVFGTFALPGGDQFVGKGPEVEALSARMMDAWLAFARDGAPGFPPYDSEKRTTMVFGRECGTQDDPQPAERKIWEGRL